MKTQIYLSFLLSLVFITPVLAESQVVTLKDGSQIKGDLVGVANGVYTIRTAMMGDVKVNSNQVNSISSGTAPAPVASNSGVLPSLPSAPASSSALDQQIQAAQSRLLNDPTMMAQVQEMAKDPEMMALLSDPSLTQAVLAHDTRAIEGNPKAQALINNPKMRALMEQLKGNTAE